MRTAVGLLCQCVQRNVLGHGQLVELLAGLREQEGGDGLVRGGGQQGLDAVCLKPGCRAQAGGKMWLQRGHGDAPVFTRVNAVTGMGAAYGCAGRR